MGGDQSVKKIEIGRFFLVYFISIHGPTYSSLVPQGNNAYVIFTIALGKLRIPHFDNLSPFHFSPHKVPFFLGYLVCNTRNTRLTILKFSICCQNQIPQIYLNCLPFVLLYIMEQINLLDFFWVDMIGS